MKNNNDNSNSNKPFNKNNDCKDGSCTDNKSGMGKQQGEKTSDQHIKKQPSSQDKWTEQTPKNKESHTPRDKDKETSQTDKNKSHEQKKHTGK